MVADVLAMQNDIALTAMVSILCPYSFPAVTSVSINRINTLRPRQNWRHFANDIFKRIFLNEDIWIPIKISLKFVPKGSIHNIRALVHIMAWRRPGDKPLSEPMMVNLPTHICVTRPQWVNNHSLHEASAALCITCDEFFISSTNMSGLVSYSDKFIKRKWEW